MTKTNELGNAGYNGLRGRSGSKQGGRQMVGARMETREQMKGMLDSDAAVRLVCHPSLYPRFHLQTQEHPDDALPTSLIFSFH